MEDYEIQAAFDEFFNAKMSAELASVAADYPDERRSVEASFKALERYNTALADELLEHPDVCLTLAAKAIEAMNLPTASGKKFSPHVRVYNLPEQNTVTVQHLGAEHLNKLVSVDGTATLITQTFPRMSAALWECIHCEETVKTYPEKNAIAQPDVCRCGRRDFKLLEQSSEFINMQRSQIQDPVEKIKGNVPAPQVDLWLEDDLTNVISPGENVVITGILRLRPVPHSKGKPAQQGRNPVYSKFFDVVHVHKQKREFEELEITREEERKIIELSRDPRLFEKFIGSIAPSIYGYDELKEAIGLQLFGGTPNKVMPDGKKIRSDMHILLVGDPGTAKSSILQYIKDLAPKAIYVSGRGASGVGLTASAEKDELTDGGWVLKAGALVLASGGIVMIDEFDKMEKEDRSAIHEALEQQSISIAKAGIVTQFKAKTSVLAAANPKHGRFDPMQPPASQFDIPPTLMSRFDLIFVIKDILDEARDRNLAEHILLGHKFAAEKTKPPENSGITPAIDLGLLRKYIAYARRKINPILTDEAALRIKDYYLELRRLGKKQNNYPVTAREIEGLIRLSEASAKLCLRDKVTLADAERAVKLAQFVLSEIFMDRETGRIDSDVINIGVAKSRIDKMRQLWSVIEALQAKFDLVDIDDIVKEATAIGLDEAYSRRLVEEMKRQGDLYEPKVGFVKSSRKKEW